MRDHRRYGWLRLPIAILLLTMLLPAVTPAVAQTSDDAASSPCTGDPAADYNGQCGPSVAIPRWSDGAGWNTRQQATSIDLVDLNGDGADELVGLGPKGLEVHTFNNQFGQWVQAYDETKPVPFSIPIVAGSIRYGQLAEGVWGVIALNTDGSSGIETWSWNPGDGSIGSGTWTLEDSGGPFQDNGGTPWNSWPAYWGTIQFLSEPLEGFGYGLIGRGVDGIQLCGWNHDAKQWKCEAAGTAFNDGVMSGSDGNPAYYLTRTVQLADIYHETAGPELFGLSTRGDGVLKVFSWDSSSQQFTELTTSGNAPFWSPQGQWYDVKYSATIQPVQLVGKDQPLQVIGRGQFGLEWYSLNTSGCGGHTPPCWKQLTSAGATDFSDAEGFGESQYWETLRFADFDGDGIDELLARNPQASPAGQIGVWKLHPNAGWYRRDITTVALTAGTSADPLWSNGNYYETIEVGNITGRDFLSMVARGKYGVRTWDVQNGFWRPQPYGFAKFTEAEQHAYELANAFVDLNPNSGTTIRTQYSTNIASTLLNYQDCITGSLNQAMPPNQVCATEGEGTLPNPNGVTAEEWQSMAKLLEAELHAAHGLTEYITNVRTLITDLYFADAGSFWNTVINLFPKPPHQSSGVWASLADLYVKLAPSIEALGGAKVADARAGLTMAQTIFNAMPSMQTPNAANSRNTRQLKIDEVQDFLSTTTAESLSTQTDIYQYIAADSGLLALFGAMTNQGFWNMTEDRLNATTSLIENHTSIWIYQTLTPVIWQIGVCNLDSRGSCNEVGGHRQENPPNFAHIGPESTPWIAFLTGSGNDAGNYISGSGSTSDLFQRVFNPNEAGTCIVGGTDPDTNWTNVGRTCNVNVSISDVVFYQNGWNHMGCKVILGGIPFDCGTQGTPDPRN